MGVWIETRWRLHQTAKTRCHTLYGCVDWNYQAVIKELERNVTPCMGVWIETLPAATDRLCRKRHTLYGCVDWNSMSKKKSIEPICHTLYGCVDWNSPR